MATRTAFGNELSEEEEGPWKGGSQGTVGSLVVDDGYRPVLLAQRMCVTASCLTEGLDLFLQQRLAARIEGKCIDEGFVQPGSVRIVSRSAGVLRDQGGVEYEVTFACNVVSFPEGTQIRCKIVENIIPGIRAQSLFTPSPMKVFLPRNEYVDSDLFASYAVGDECIATVVAQRYTMGATHISVIATLTE